MLSNYKDISLNYVSPPSLRMPQSIQEELSLLGVHQVELETYADVMQETDVLYMTRIQKERFATEEAYQAVKGQYVLTADDLKSAKPASEMVL